jgi:hypothetical protein
MLEQPSVDEVLTAFQNQENGLPPGLQELLAGHSPEEQAILMQGLIKLLTDYKSGK